MALHPALSFVHASMWRVSRNLSLDRAPDPLPDSSTRRFFFFPDRLPFDSVADRQKERFKTNKGWPTSPPGEADL